MYYVYKYIYTGFLQTIDLIYILGIIPTYTILLLVFLIFFFIINIYCDPPLRRVYAYRYALRETRQALCVYR